MARAQTRLNLAGDNISLCAFNASIGDDGRGSEGLITQYGVLPYRIEATGGMEILLITSRETGRWVTPKGNPIPGLPGHQTAAREAFEEAGVEGIVSEAPLGRFAYAKRRRSGETVAALVTVYALRVTRQHLDWPERGQRTIRWFALGDAAMAVHEPDLKALILSFGPEAVG